MGAHHNRPYIVLCEKLANFWVKVWEKCPIILLEYGCLFQLNVSQNYLKFELTCNGTILHFLLGNDWPSSTIYFQPQLWNLWTMHTRYSQTSSNLAWKLFTSAVFYHLCANKAQKGFSHIGHSYIPAWHIAGCSELTVQWFADLKQKPCMQCDP